MVVNKKQPVKDAAKRQLPIKPFSPTFSTPRPCRIHVTAEDSAMAFTSKSLHIIHGIIVFLFLLY